MTVLVVLKCINMEDLRGLTDKEVRDLPQREVTRIARAFVPRILGVLADERERSFAELRRVIREQTGVDGTFVGIVDYQLYRQRLIDRVREEIPSRNDPIIGYYKISEKGVREAWRFSDEESQLKR